MSQALQVTSHMQCIAKGSLHSLSQQSDCLCTTSNFSFIDHRALQNAAVKHPSSFSQPATLTMLALFRTQVPARMLVQQALPSGAQATAQSCAYCSNDSANRKSEGNGPETEVRHNVYTSLRKFVHVTDQVMQSPSRSMPPQGVTADNPAVRDSGRHLGAFRP